MKDKHTAKAVLTDNNQPVVIQPPVEVERILSEEKTLIDMLKHQRDLALSNAKLAEANHRNIILTLAVKYHLSNGDTINDDGTITRKIGQ